MSCVEQQQEEVEVLQSIYDGDENFKQQGDTVFQYKVGENQTSKSFVLEVSWGAEYPDQLPSINLDTFYNKHLLSEVKTHIQETLTEEAEANIGCAVTYTLFEYAKENAAELMKHQPDTVIQVAENQENLDQQQQGKCKEKKEQLTKSQKRKMTNRLDHKGELPRGWNWMDVVKHLSQTGRSAIEKS